MPDTLQFNFHCCPQCGYSQVLLADDVRHYCPIDSTPTEERPAKDSDKPDGRDERTEDMLL